MSNAIRGAQLTKINETVTGAVALAEKITITRATRLISLTLKFNTAPTTAGNITISVDALAGAAYDYQIGAVVDPTTKTTVEVRPTTEVWLETGDVLQVDYANPDGRTIGLQTTLIESY